MNGPQPNCVALSAAAPAHGASLRRIPGATITATIALLLLSLAGCAAQPSTAPQAQMEALVKDYLLAHPEVIQQSLSQQAQRDAEAEKARQQATLDQNYDLIAWDPAAPVAGNPKGDVTIVEFLDYHCHYCRQADPAMREMVKQDGNIRLVYHQFPILGPDSALAARSVLAAAKQGKLTPLHEALFRSDKLDEPTIDALAQIIGLDMQRFHADRDSKDTILQIQRDYGLAQALGINGTPGFVIGHTLMTGTGDIDSIKAVVALSRKLPSAHAATASAALPSSP